MERAQEKVYSTHPDQREMADHSVEILANDQGICMIINSGRYQITIEID